MILETLTGRFLPQPTREQHGSQQHRATHRDIFARGALQAAAWLAGKPPGLYAIADLLGDAIGLDSAPRSR